MPESTCGADGASIVADDDGGGTSRATTPGTPPGDADHLFIGNDGANVSRSETAETAAAAAAASSGHRGRQQKGSSAPLTEIGRVVGPGRSHRVRAEHTVRDVHQITSLPISEQIVLRFRCATSIILHQMCMRVYVSWNFLGSVSLLKN